MNPTDGWSTPADVLVIAAEASADRHAARLLRRLSEISPALRFIGIGGAELRNAGMHTPVDAAEMNVVGFVEVARRYRFLRRVYNDVLRHVDAHPPRLAILVDYPGFNLRLARELHRRGIPVAYYIAPQTWAWKEGRVEDLRRYVDALVVVFPFEEAYFRKHGVEAVFLGHPMLDEDPYGDALELPTGGTPRVIAYLPGSRPEELRRHLPLVAAVIKRLGSGWRHRIARASTVDAAQIREAIDGFPKSVEIVDGGRRALAGAHVALVKSGTSTLDATMSGVPFAVFYRTSPVSYAIARVAIRVDFIAMPNILAGRRVVREFVQGDATPEAIEDELLRLAGDKHYRATVIEGLSDVRRGLGAPGHAHRTAMWLAERFAL